MAAIRTFGTLPPDTDVKIYKRVQDFFVFEQGNDPIGEFTSDEWGAAVISDLDRDQRYWLVYEDAAGNVKQVGVTAKYDNPPPKTKVRRETSVKDGAKAEEREKKTDRRTTASPEKHAAQSQPRVVHGPRSTQTVREQTRNTGGGVKKTDPGVNLPRKEDK